MANSKGTQNLRDAACSGKQAFLPPKSPFLGGPTFFPDFVPNGFIGSKPVQMPREGNTHHHHRTSSESFLIEEQPSWLDDLLNEPDTPVRKAGHRRSSSDSFAYVDVTNASNLHYSLWDDSRYKNSFAGHHGNGPKEFDYVKDSRYVSFHPAFHSGNQKNKASDSISDSGAHPSSGSRYLENTCAPSSGSSDVPYETEKVSCAADGKMAPAAQFSNNSSKASFEKKDAPQAKPAASEADTKRARQQFAQRSRVRKIQYIAELERNVQALQAEGSEVSAGLEFANQQNLILSMENKALKQRLESLAQEQLIKHLEHEVLEKEIVRLRALYQQQQQQQQLETKKQVSSSHLRSRSRDMESQFTNLSLRP
ncbi:PREDICTED: uncharacterized protein At4g06598-like [Tarenaya hassleriana]|uniref:uncharacterized protein At4g06598-like n=1 Tax=Tarenaya hassleriana TaxID=28532 RepID=UPI00053C4049|nr:PREDICTED: uncharacterized protein At4g06598-like [Tarenaya hassleriana]XP_010530543.1 PREDICTED: uncharacterized protein At4g06598-like [Tarenaya hassleriana]